MADPYNQNSWNGIRSWLGGTKVNLNWLKLKDRVAVNIKDGKTNITLDETLPKDDQVIMGAWLSYGVSRALWMGGKFAKEYPNESAYRHSLREESESIHMFITVSAELAAKEKRDLSNSDFGTLAKIEKAGLLQPFVLLNRADDGIAKDFGAYRDSNRELLRRYLDDFVVPKTPPTADVAQKPSGSS